MHKKCVPFWKVSAQKSRNKISWERKLDQDIDNEKYFKAYEKTKNELEKI